MELPLSLARDWIEYSMLNEEGMICGSSKLLFWSLFSLSDNVEEPYTHL